LPQERGLGLGKLNEVRKLDKDEFYKCPLPHLHPRHKQAFFKNFDQHFRIFNDRDDHQEVAQLYMQIAWEARRAASEKGRMSEQEMQTISFAAWLEAVKKKTGKPIQVVKKQK